jgi:hypothetical protein
METAGILLGKENPRVWAESISPLCMKCCKKYLPDDMLDDETLDDDTLDDE